MSQDNIQMLSGQLHFQKALFEAHQGNIEGALVEFDNAFEKDPKFGYLLNKGKLLAQHGRFDEAISIFRNISEDGPEGQEAKAALERANELLQRPDGVEVIQKPIWKRLPIKEGIGLLFLITTFVFGTLFFSLQSKYEEQKKDYNQVKSMLQNGMTELDQAVVQEQQSREEALRSIKSDLGRLSTQISDSILPVQNIQLTNINREIADLQLQMSQLLEQLMDTVQTNEDTP